MRVDVGLLGEHTATSGKKRVSRILATVGLAIGLLIGSATPATASWEWWDWTFYGGSAFYSGSTIGQQGGYYLLDPPRVGRSTIGFGHVCDWQAAVQFWTNGYWYPYDYSSYHHGCWYFWRWADFWQWDDTWVPSNTYTHGWWTDWDTGGWRNVAAGWVS